MKIIKEKIMQEPSKSNRSAFLELAKKDDKGIPRPYPADNPIHIVKLLRAEEGINKDFYQKEVEGIWLHFEEDGTEKKYFVPTYYTDKNKENYGKFHYLFERFSDIEEGEMLEMEYIKKGTGGFIRVDKASDKTNDDIPVIEENEVSVEDIPY
jgi:hypothetical protein